MKIVQSFAAILVCISSSTLLHAQEIKTEIAKPLEVKIPSTDANKPSPQPVFKPQPQVAATEAPAAAAETPSPLTRKEDAKPADKEKMEVKIVSENDIVTPGGEEGRKVMAGKTTRPKDPIYSPSTADAKPAPPVSKSPASNQQQQQQ